MRQTKAINVTGNPNWRYHRSDKTDLKKTFARIERENDAAKQRELDAIQKMRPQLVRSA